jgi:hypothetical protein
MKHSLLLVLLLISFSCLSQTQQVILHTVYFDFNKSEISSQEEDSLQGFLKKIQGKRILSVNISGHTDEIGSKSYNDALSFQRAKVVAEIIKRGLESSVEIISESFGKEQPITSEPNKQHLNRRVEIGISFSTPASEKVETILEPFFEDVELQEYEINLNDTVWIYGKEGTVIKVSPGSIQNRKGHVVWGIAKLQLKEYYQPGDIMLSGLNTLSMDKLLETGGMFSLLIIKGKDTMSDRSVKPVEIRMPVINKTSDSEKMNVFERSHLDTTNWQKTDSFFSITNSYWDFPPYEGKLRHWSLDKMNFHDWKNGHKVEEEIYSGGWNLFRRKSRKGEIKKQIHFIQKLDSATLRVKVKIRFRNFGLRTHGLRNFDTTFLVKFKRKEYVGFTYAVNWINCDRFLNYPKVIDYYISTPNFNGAHVMVYFKKLKAFMQASLIENDKYAISRIPPGEDVMIVAFGKKDSVYYLGKKDFITIEKGTGEMNIYQISKDDFYKEMKSF